MMKKYLFFGLVYGAIVAGVLLRLAGLEEKLFWHDEVYTQIFAAGYESADWQKAAYGGEVIDVEQILEFRRYNPEKTIFDVIRSLASDEPQNPPLYFLLARAWASLFGGSAGALRLFSVLCSFLSLAAAFCLGRELFAEKEKALVVTALLSVSPFFVLYAQEARSYTLWSVWIFFSCAALLRALRVTEERESLKAALSAWGLYAFSVLLSLYTSFSTVSVLLAQVAFLVVRERFGFTRSMMAMGGALAAAGLFFLPWGLVLLKNFAAFEASTAWISDIVIPRTELLQILARNAGRVFFDYEPVPGWAALSGAFFGVAAVLVFAVPRKEMSRNGLFMVFMIAAPLVILFIPDLLFGGIRSISSRYLTPAWAGLVVIAGALAADWYRNKKYGFLLPVLLILTAGVSSALNATRPVVWTKSVSVKLPEAAELINQHENSLIVCNRELHHPGNLLAVSSLLRPGTKIQFPPFERGYRIPEGYRHVYLWGANPPFREELLRNEKIKLHLLIDGLYLKLWKVEFL